MWTFCIHNSESGKIILMPTLAFNYSMSTNIFNISDFLSYMYNRSHQLAEIMLAKPLISIFLSYNGIMMFWFPSSSSLCQLNKEN